MLLQWVQLHRFVCELGQTLSQHLTGAVLASYPALAGIVCCVSASELALPKCRHVDVACCAACMACMACSADQGRDLIDAQQVATNLAGDMPVC